MEAIRYYVKGAFVGIAETPEVLEQQEELIADMSAKVADLVADGRTEEEALGFTIASMGDLSGLVRELQTEEAVTVASGPATVEVRINSLRLHAVTISVVAVIGALFVITVMAAFTGALDGIAVAWDLLFGIVGVAWIGWALYRFHMGGYAVEEVELDQRKRLTQSAIQWVVVSIIAFFANLNGGEFWAWTVWIAAGAWPLHVFAEQWLVRSGHFLHSEVEPEPSAASFAGATTGEPV